MNELLEKNVYCPYCGEQISVVIEVLDENQEYIEDCQVCCRPITFDVMMANDGQASISVRSENDTF
ncbi:MAG: transcription elongation factor Elf1 [Oleiphilaceae bacterium]